MHFSKLKFHTQKSRKEFIPLCVNMSIERKGCSAEMLSFINIILKAENWNFSHILFEHKECEAEKTAK